MTKKSKASSLFVLDGSEEDYAQNYWEDMPEFEQNDLDIYGSMNIAFRTEEDFRAFVQLIEQPSVSIKSRGVYYPVRAKSENTLLRWMPDEE